MEVGAHQAEDLDKPSHRANQDPAGLEISCFPVFADLQIRGVFHVDRRSEENQLARLELSPFPASPKTPNTRENYFPLSKDTKGAAVAPYINETLARLGLGEELPPGPMETAA